MKFLSLNCEVVKFLYLHGEVKIYGRSELFKNNIYDSPFFSKPLKSPPLRRKTNKGGLRPKSCQYLKRVYLNCIFEHLRVLASGKKWGELYRGLGGFNFT